MVLKKCVICETEFNARGRDKTCSKKCSKTLEREYQKEWRRKNETRYLEGKQKWIESHKEHLRKYHRSYTAKYYRKRKRRLVDMLGGKCQKCGYDKCLSALEFHHLNPEEKESQREFQNGGKKFEQKIKEGKITLLCANCHREEHHSDF